MIDGLVKGCSTLASRFAREFRTNGLAVGTDSSSVQKANPFNFKEAHDHSFFYPGVSLVTEYQIPELTYHARPKTGDGHNSLAGMQYTTSQQPSDSRTLS